jgi:hypothetical protein
MDDQVTAQQYRKRALELRDIAKQLEGGNFKRLILSLAQDYEELAQKVLTRMSIVALME